MEMLKRRGRESRIADNFQAISDEGVPLKKLGFIAMVTLAGCLLAAPLVSAQGKKARKAKTWSAEEQIKVLQAETVQALLKPDTGFFAKYYADDAVIIGGIGTQLTKAQEIADLKSGHVKFDSEDVRDQRIRIYGNTAVVNQVVSAKGLLGSEPWGGDFRLTYVWVKLKGSWRIVSRQSTKIPPSQ